MAGSHFNVSGSLGSANAVSKSFYPNANLGMNVSVWGTFVGTVQMQRSFDNGATWLPLTSGGAATKSFTAPASEMWTEVEQGVAYRLQCTAYTSGTINYRLSQG